MRHFSRNPNSRKIFTKYHYNPDLRDRGSIYVWNKQNVQTLIPNVRLVQHRKLTLQYCLRPFDRLNPFTHTSLFSFVVVLPLVVDLVGVQFNLEPFWGVLINVSSLGISSADSWVEPCKYLTMNSRLRGCRVSLYSDIPEIKYQVI